MLQSMQIIIPQDISLPKEIEEIEITGNFKKQGFACLIDSNIKRIDSEYYRGDAEAKQKNAYLRIKNCRLKILDSILTNPTAFDLVDKQNRFQRSMDAKLTDLTNRFGFEYPNIKCFICDELRNSSKERRHEIEVPIIKEAIKGLFDRDEKILGDFKISWSKTGKPKIESLDKIGVSVSHDGALLIVVAGYEDQGCDVQTVNVRTPKEWVALLGKAKFDLLKEYKLINFELDKAATAIWTASEVAEKLFNAEYKLSLLENKPDFFLFKIVSSNLEREVLCLPMKIGAKINSIPQPMAGKCCGFRAGGGNHYGCAGLCPHRQFRGGTSLRLYPRS